MSTPEVKVCSTNSENIFSNILSGDEDEMDESPHSATFFQNPLVSHSSVLESSSKSSQSEINIKCRPGGDTLPANYDDDENSEDQPVVGKSPVIQTKNHLEGKMEKENIINNLNLPNTKRASKEFKIENTSDENKDKIGFKLPKSESKPKHKSKPREHSVRIKTKFAPGSIQFISEQLKDIVFSGWVGEREYVEKLRAYRDIIEVDEWEDNLNQRLKAVVHGVRGVMEGTKWINITVPSSVSHFYCLWVLLDKPPCPGHYWMHITDINPDPEFGLKISVRILREIHNFDGENKAARERRLKGELDTEEWKEWALSVISLDIKYLWMSVLALLTPSNIGSIFRLVVVLGATFIVALSTFVQHSLVFLLHFLREFGIFIHHATPVAQSVIGFFEKVVGGFFLLLAMLYRDLRQPRSLPPPSHYPPMGHLAVGPPDRSPRPLTNVQRQSWVFRQEDSD